MGEENCIFCKIVKGEIPSTTIYENSEFKVMMDVAPANPGHVLVIPKEHFENIFDIDAITAGKLFQLVTVVARAVKEAMHCDGMNIVQNNGKVAGQTVNHFHMHVIPRYEGDGMQIAWKEHTEVNRDELEAIKDQIKKAL